jgi:hypothetical protein
MPTADVFSTPNMLNATLPLKQDAESQAKLQAFAAEFKSKWADQVWKVLKDSNMVHYARFTVIDNKYMQILTEFDGDFIAYSRFFASKLPEFFRTVFTLVDADIPRGAGGEADLSLIFEYINKRNLPNVGGVAFSAIGPFRVPEVKRALDVTD